MASGNFYVSLKQPSSYASQEFSYVSAPSSSSSTLKNNAASELNQDSAVYYSIVGTSAGIIALALYQLIVSAIYAGNRRKEQSHG